MINISRKIFLKITAAGLVFTVFLCGCVLENNADENPEKSSPSKNDTEENSKNLKTVAFYPDKVAYICGCKPDLHNPGSGGDQRLFIGNYCKYSERFLLHWNLSILPSEQKITKAVMALYCTEIHGSVSGKLQYAPLISDWGDNVTYNNQPAQDTSKLMTVDWPAEACWHKVDMTDIVRKWLENPDLNYGIIGYSVDVKDETCSAIFASVLSSDALQPRLVITTESIEKEEG